jgi:DNA polymerase I-like protein with 3'-5' exonuclease and polymerase domains
VPSPHKRANTTCYFVEFYRVIFCLGSAADLCKSAMLQTQHKLQERHLAHDARLLLQIHDELLWEVNAAQLTNVRGEWSCLKSRKSM